jgi:hypothetical protein
MKSFNLNCFKCLIKANFFFILDYLQLSIFIIISYSLLSLAQNLSFKYLVFNNFNYQIKQSANESDYM